MFNTRVTTSFSKLVIATQGQNAVSSPIVDMSCLICSHEEADTRLLFHAFHAYNQGYRKLMVCATDTDVVVIAIAVASVLDNCENMSSIWPWLKGTLHPMSPNCSQSRQ